jgi:SAM-dependent methyltransferase
MKVCVQCESRLDRNGWCCPNCGNDPPIVDSIVRLVPNMPTVGAGYEAEYFSELADVEAQNFWFRSRNRLVIWALEEFFPDARSFLEVGCGNGFVLCGVRTARPELAVVGAELFKEGLDIARTRLPGVPLIQADARRLPYDAEFDVIGAFDVLEHIREDEEALTQLYRAVRPGGGIVLTVPQHPNLWSAADDYARHERRYVRSELVRKVREAGFLVVHTTSFVSLLLPLLAASRIRRRRLDATFDPLAELRNGRVLDTILERVMSLELWLTRRRWQWAAGGSLLLVGRRPLTS